MAVVYRYIGDGAWLPGIPARDLTDEDMALLTDAQRADVEQAAIYKAAGKPAKPAEQEG